MSQVTRQEGGRRQEYYGLPEGINSAACFPAGALRSLAYSCRAVLLSMVKHASGNTLPRANVTETVIIACFHDIGERTDAAVLFTFPPIGYFREVFGKNYSHFVRGWEDITGPSVQ